MIKKLIGVLLFLIFLCPLVLFLLWVFTPEKRINILILDKTVLESKVQEHGSFNWILIHNKYVNHKGESHIGNLDYFGFFPDDKGGYKINDYNNYSYEALDLLAENNDVVFYTDLSGVSQGEWFERYPEVFSEMNHTNGSLDYLKKIYGGMTKQEMFFLQLMKERKKLVIAEYNVIALPTPNIVRQTFEEEFNMQWSGWVGKYFDTLDTLKSDELPRWLKQNYLKQHSNNWPFTKSGIVFVKTDEQIEILESETHLVVGTPVIYTSEKYRLKYDLPEEMKFPFWFDIITTDEQNDIVSIYKIEANEVGQMNLMQWGIPQYFPAVIEHDKLDYKFHYFAGDFSNNPIGLTSSKFKWAEVFNDFSYIKSVQERKSFFWHFYRPMMQKIIGNYYEKMNEKD